MFNQLKKDNLTLTGLVNNAGVGLNKPAHLASESEFDNLYSVDIRGLWLMSKFFVNQLISNNITGNIVNVSSVHSHSTTHGYALYASAKSAVDSLTRGMAVELGQHNIRINSLAPGYVHAEQNFDLISAWTDDPKAWVANHSENQQALQHCISNQDCGQVAAFLLSSMSCSVTGQTMYVDNGTTSMLYNNDIFPKVKNPPVK